MRFVGHGPGYCRDVEKFIWLTKSGKDENYLIYFMCSPTVAHIYIYIIHILTYIIDFYSLWHLFWQIFWHTIWHILWLSIWHGARRAPESWQDRCRRRLKKQGAISNNSCQQEKRIDSRKDMCPFYANWDMTCLFLKASFMLWWTWTLSRQNSSHFGLIFFVTLKQSISA